MDENISPGCEINNQSEMDYDFSILPPHVLANILSHLAIVDFRNASETCKAFYYASCDPRISEQIYLRFSSQPAHPVDICVRPVTKLRFEYLNFDKFDYKKLLRNFGHKITELNILSCSKLRFTQLFEMFIELPNLKVLRLENGARNFKLNNYEKHRRITRHKARIMRNLGRVQELHISTLETDLKGAEILLNCCTNVKKFSWNENSYNDNTIDHFLHNVLINQNNNCTSERLESLTVHTIDRKQNSQFFEHLINLNRIGLRSLDLRNINVEYYDVMFKEFCKTYKTLERLTMNGCNSEQLVDVCKYMRDLKTLNLSNIIATNINHIGYLNNLETLILQQYVFSTDDLLIELIRRQQKHLVDLTLSNITHVLFKEICENLPQLKRLNLENIESRECEPLFRHLTKLEILHLEFTEITQINSRDIINDPEWNVTKLTELEDLYINTFLPGFTPDLIAKLPKLKTTFHEHVYDPDPQADEERNINQRTDLPDDYDDDGGQNYDDDGGENDDVAGDVPEEEEIPEYDLMDFDVYSVWLCDTDTEINVIYQ